MIFRLALAAFALSAAVPAAAQEEERPAAFGVWAGTIGDLPIHACLGGGEGRSASLYYYDRYLALIRLEPTQEGWSERTGFAQQDGAARWQITQVSDDVATGVWSDETRRLPIRLERIAPVPVDDFFQPCEAPEFALPRLAGGRIEARPARWGTFAYTRLDFVPPPHFQALEPDGYPAVSISSFALPSGPAGDDAINRILAEYLPHGDASDDYAQCLTGSFAFTGMDGDYAQSVEPEALTTRFLGVVESNSNFCGGAHPNHWQRRRVFDRLYGREVDVQSWLNDRALTRELFDAGADSFVSVGFTEELRTMIVQFWPEGGDAECREIAQETREWDFGLVANGLVFQPDLPHALTPCEESMVVPWHAMAPFLSVEGQAARIAAEAG